LGKCCSRAPPLSGRGVQRRGVVGCGCASNRSERPMPVARRQVRGGGGGLVRWGSGTHLTGPACGRKTSGAVCGRDGAGTCALIYSPTASRTGGLTGCPLMARWAAPPSATTGIGRPTTHHIPRRCLTPPQNRPPEPSHPPLPLCLHRHRADTPPSQPPLHPESRVGLAKTASPNQAAIALEHRRAPSLCPRNLGSSNPSGTPRAHCRDPHLASCAGVAAMALSTAGRIRGGSNRHERQVASRVACGRPRQAAALI